MAILRDIKYFRKDVINIFFLSEKLTLNFLSFVLSKIEQLNLNQKTTIQPPTHRFHFSESLTQDIIISFFELTSQGAFFPPEYEATDLISNSFLFLSISPKSFRILNFRKKKIDKKELGSSTIRKLYHVSSLRKLIGSVQIMRKIK